MQPRSCIFKKFRLDLARVSQGAFSCAVHTCASFLWSGSIAVYDDTAWTKVLIRAWRPVPRISVLCAFPCNCFLQDPLVVQVRRGIVERALAGLLNAASAGEEARGSLFTRIQECARSFFLSLALRDTLERPSKCHADQPHVACRPLILIGTRLMPASRLSNSPLQ